MLSTFDERVLSCQITQRQGLQKLGTSTGRSQVAFITIPCTSRQPGSNNRNSKKWVGAYRIPPRASKHRPKVRDYPVMPTRDRTTCACHVRWTALARVRAAWRPSFGRSALACTSSGCAIGRATGRSRFAAIVRATSLFRCTTVARTAIARTALARTALARTALARTALARSTRLDGLSAVARTAVARAARRLHAARGARFGRITGSPRLGRVTDT